MTIWNLLDILQYCGDRGILYTPTDSAADV